MSGTCFPGREAAELPAPPSELPVPPAVHVPIPHTLLSIPPAKVSFDPGLDANFGGSVLPHDGISMPSTTQEAPGFAAPQHCNEDSVTSTLTPLRADASPYLPTATSTPSVWDPPSLVDKTVPCISQHNGAWYLRDKESDDDSLDPPVPWPSGTNNYGNPGIWPPSMYRTAPTQQCYDLGDVTDWHMDLAMHDQCLAHQWVGDGSESIVKRPSKEVRLKIKRRANQAINRARASRAPADIQVLKDLAYKNSFLHCILVRALEEFGEYAPAA